MRNLARQNWFKRSAGLGYAVVTVGVITAIIANLLLETSLQTSPTLFLFLCAIIFAAWFGGVGPGLARSRADLEDKVRDLEKLNAALKIGECRPAIPTYWSREFRVDNRELFSTNREFAKKFRQTQSIGIVVGK